MRDHVAIPVENFEGLWVRGDIDSVPKDHFSNCNNVKYSESSFLSRDGIGPHAPYKNIVRGYPFNQSEVLLDVDGNIYHNDRSNRYVPILSLAGMTDFKIAKFANRIYICPIGLESTIYVYTYGDTNGARKAAGQAPGVAPGVSTGSGNCEQGVHVISVVYETDTGFLTKLGPRVSIALDDNEKSIIVDIPPSPNSYVIKAHVVATKAIDPADFTGNLDGYQFFFVPNAVGTGTVTANFYDAELLEDASHLDDLFEEIPNGNGIALYHNRVIVYGLNIGIGNVHISDSYLSAAGEPEAVDKVDGLISLTPDGTPITNVQELRDSLYIFKQTRTFATIDNQDVPSQWPVTSIDDGIGATSHGVGTIMDGTGINIDYLLVADFAGLLLFNGTYQFPELTYKVKDFWPNVDRSEFTKVQITVDSQFHFIYIVYPNGSMLIGDYNNGLNYKAIKWTPMTANILFTSTFMLEESDRLRLIICSKNS